MKKTLIFACLLACSMASAMAQQAKYVFYFIGDGMGMNQVNGTETYLAALQGRIGIEPLCFAGFPYTGYGTSFSFTNGVTDSAAAGTALSTGTKTYNGAIGVDKDTTAIYSIAHYAKLSGKRVGVATTVGIDHATPAAFYAHAKNRNLYNQIGHQLPESNYDFFGGADFHQPIDKNKPGDRHLHDVVKDAGYTIALGYNEAKAAVQKADKMFMTQTAEATKEYGSELPYAIDRKPGDLSLKQIVEVGIDFLMKDSKKGFFFMIEGGKIDYAGHANDAAACFQETIDMDEAVKVAYEFYKKHPKETLIVVTADHETGGLGLGNGQYALNLQVLQHQTVSVAKATKKLGALRREGHTVTWEEAKSVLSECFGLFTKVQVNWRDEAELRKTFEDHFRKGEKQQSLYQSDDVLASAARVLLCRIAMLAWVSGSHSNAYVPIFAVGAGAEQFTGRMNNIDIPAKIAKLGGYKK